jgi:hypothetical protein
MTGTPNLRWLLGWANRQYTAETPELQHSVSRVDEGGGPAMGQGVAIYLGLAGSYKAQQPWALDDDGRYRTPLRAALASIGRRNPELGIFLRDLVPNSLMPSEVARVHGIPRWAEAEMMHRALLILWHAFLEQPPVSWVDISDASRNAIVAGEAVA